MLGSAIGKGDGDAATLTKKREERRFDEQYLKGVGTGSLGTTIMPELNRNRRRSRSSSRSYFDHLSLRK
jgi:hypothetical protein